MPKLVLLFAGSLLSTVSVADASKGEAYFSSLNGGQCHSCHRETEKPGQIY
jgi:cytochrome c551/c552